MPPGYKDGAKADTGIGDYLIWLSLLRIGREKNKDLVFVTGEEKSDWFVRSGGEAVYPRPELVDEYRRASAGKNLRLSTLHGLLREMQAPSSVINEVQRAEDREKLLSRKADNVPILVELDLEHGRTIKRFSNGNLTVDVNIGAFNHDILIYPAPTNRRMAAFRGGASSGKQLFMEDAKGKTLASGIRPGMLIVVEGMDGAVFVARILTVDIQGANLTLAYYITGPGEPIFAP
jgi:hypothetical protein